jgi:hypothetical protein
VSSNYSFSLKSDGDASGSGGRLGRDETDKANGNVPPPSPPTSPPPVDNINEWNIKFDGRRKSTDTTAVEQTDVEPAQVIVELDNVRSNKNLNRKNQLGSSPSNGQVISYWTSQALQNDNVQKISEVNFPGIENIRK